MRTLLVALLAVVAIAHSAQASHCMPQDDTSELDPCAEVDTVVCVFVDWDEDCLACMPTIWLYEDCNGIPGWQDDWQYCHGMIEADCIVF